MARRIPLLGPLLLAPSLAVVILFFLLPVALTVVFSFTNMSTSTGILGGAYRLTTSDLPHLAEKGVTPPTIDVLAGGYVISEPALARFAETHGARRAAVLRQDHLGARFDQRRDVERLLKELRPDPIRSVADRKAAAEIFSASILDARYSDATAFADALAGMGVPEADIAPLTRAAYTGWTFTTANFELLARLPATLRYAANTAFYVVCTLGFNIGFGLFLAISTFYLPDRVAQTFRTLWFLPRILPPVLYVLMWQWLTWDHGFLSQVFAPFGVAPRNWMMDSAGHAWTMVVLINGCVGASLGMILFSSAIRTIPAQLFHAAAVDGANRWLQVRHIILPQLRWPILFMTSYQTLSLLTSFEYILLATDGGPGRTTEVWSLAAYHTALNNYGGNLEYGLGAAYALVLVIIGIALSLIYMRFFNFADLVAKPRIEQ